jgi:tRNA-splicing endonuclease subunit Sen54
MHNALAYTRLHHPQKVVIGTYAADGPFAVSSLLPTTIPVKAGASVESSREETEANISSPEKAPLQRRTASKGVSKDACVYVTNPKGQFLRTMGQGDRWGGVWLLPEEALYLLERGSMDIRWPASITGVTVDQKPFDAPDDEKFGIPMSLQAAYTCFIGRGGLTLERFSVFSALRRLGYILLRAPSWHDEYEGSDITPFAHNASFKATDRSTFLTNIKKLFGFLWERDGSIPSRNIPLVGLGIHRSYGMGRHLVV